MRLPVGSVVFVSHRLVGEGVLLCKFFRQKFFPTNGKLEQLFFDETQFAEPKAPVATFAY